jgi:threonyl-tRNA synthetase
VKNKTFENEKQQEEHTPSSDHRVMGQRLGFYSINEQVGVGLVLWHPKGTTVRRLIRDYWEKEHLKHRYQLVHTPHIARGELWKTSGHLEYYAENMFVFDTEGEPYVVKPMNCPLHIQIYKSQLKSYRDLTIKYAEWGNV